MSDHRTQKLQGKQKVPLADIFIKIAEQPTEISVGICSEHSKTVTCVCVSSDGSQVFTGSKCSSVVKWSTLNQPTVATATDKSNNLIMGSVISIAISADSKFLAIADESSEIKLWDPTILKLIHSFEGHENNVKGVVFSEDAQNLYSCSSSSIKIWSLDEMTCVKTLFGLESKIDMIDTLSRERAISACGCNVIIWKIAEGSQLMFKSLDGRTSVEELKVLDKEHFVSGSTDGSINLWSDRNKNPLYTVVAAHGSNPYNKVPFRIISLATIYNSDVFASGSVDNSIKIWKITNIAYYNRSVTNILSVPINGFVNCMQFSEGGKRLYAAVGQEHKVMNIPVSYNAKNSLLLIHFNLRVSC